MHYSISNAKLQNFFDIFFFLSKLKALKISINFIIFAIFLKLLRLCCIFLKFRRLYIYNKLIKNIN